MGRSHRWKKVEVLSNLTGKPTGNGLPREVDVWTISEWILKK